MRPRVLVEHADPGSGAEVARALRHSGFAVATCPGPSWLDPCPLLEGHDCPLITGADVVVSDLDGNPDAASIVACVAERFPRTPLLLDVEPDEAAWVVSQALSG